MGLNAGQLDREIVLQTATAVQSESGEPIVTWGDDDTIWAQWLPAGTREAWQAQQRLGSYVDGVFQIYDRAIRPTPDTTRILFDGRVFDVKPYMEIGRGEGLLVPVVARGE
jgi:SPP1 family predicted phage head-tail adaptor